MSAAPGLTLCGSAEAGGRRLFPRIAFEAPPGVWTCLIGPSGVGKSTVLRLLAGLPTGVRFEGRVAASDGQDLAGRVAWMAQDDLLLPWLDVAGNVALGARLRGGRADPDAVRALVARVGLGAQSGQRPAALSGGQRQRAALARTLMEDRPVVLLDEPFSALDARTRAEMQNLAFAMLASKTVVLVTHDPGEAARLGARLWLMSETGLAEVAPPPGPAIRALDDPESLRVQGALLRRLREGAPS